MTKTELRKTYKEKRKHLSAQEKETATHKITQLLLPLIPDGAMVHCFLPIEKLKEIDTILLIMLFKKMKPNIRWASSISDFDTLSMPCYTLDINQLQISEYGIPEPAAPLTAINSAEIEYVITPLLVADNRGYRVGYGKGFYDRFFASLPASCIKIGINYFGVLEENLEINAFDVALNHHVSPFGITTFTP